MEPTEHAMTTTHWFENNTASLTPSPTEFPFSTDWDLITAIIPPYIFILCVLGLLGNSFVLLVFLIHRDRLNTPEIYLSNLALADFMLLVCLPFWAAYIYNYFNWLYGDVLCKLVNSFIIVNFYTSIYILAMISIDRYLAIVKTMKVLRLRRTLYTKVICVILWFFGLLMSLPTMLHRKVKFLEDHETLSCILDFDWPWKLTHQISMNVAGFVLPVLVIAYCSSSIIQTLRKRSKSVYSQEATDRKAIALVYAVTLLFILCWSPFQLFTFLDTLCDMNVLYEDEWFHILDTGHQVSVYVAFLNSALNPVLYVFSGQYFRKKVKAICRSDGRHRRGSDMTVYQRSVVSTFVNRTDLIKSVTLSDSRKSSMNVLHGIPPSRLH